MSLFVSFSVGWGREMALGVKEKVRDGGQEINGASLEEDGAAECKSTVGGIHHLHGRG